MIGGAKTVGAVVPLSERCPQAKARRTSDFVSLAREQALEAPRIAQRSQRGAATDLLPQSLQELLNYQRDFMERAVLFLDTLRQRADNMLEHERTGMPAMAMMPMGGASR